MRVLFLERQDLRTGHERYRRADARCVVREIGSAPGARPPIPSYPRSGSAWEPARQARIDALMEAVFVGRNWAQAEKWPVIN